MTRADRDHLHTLAICHYVVGGMCALFGTIPVVHLVVGILIINGGGGQQQQGPNPMPIPPELFGWIFICIAAAMIVFYWSLALALVVAGRCLNLRKWRPFCLVTAGFACLFQPIGTALGIFTFIVLLRPSVREAFEPVREEPSEFDSYRTE
jgi:hypothetical protein